MFILLMILQVRNLREGSLSLFYTMLSGTAGGPRPERAFHSCDQPIQYSSVSLSPCNVSSSRSCAHSLTLHRGCLRVAAFLTGRLVSKRQNVEHAKPIKGHKKNWHQVISTVWPWSKQAWSLSRQKARRNRLHHMIKYSKFSSKKSMWNNLAIFGKFNIPQ